MSDERTISFEYDQQYTNKLILEQAIHLHATLSTILSVQIKMLAHLTGEDFKSLRDHYIGDQLNSFEDGIAEEIQQSIAAQAALRDRRNS